MSFDVFDLFEGVINTLDYADSASPKNKIKKILSYHYYPNVHLLFLAATH